MNPQDQEYNMRRDDDKENENEQLKHQQKLIKDYKQIIERKHPNTLTFDHKDRLFVGDSSGQINVWRVNIQYGTISVVDHFLIKHKEIEGD